MKYALNFIGQAFNGVKISPQLNSPAEFNGAGGINQEKKHLMVHLQFEFTKIYGDIGPAVSGTIASWLLSL